MQFFLRATFLIILATKCNIEIAALRNKGTYDFDKSLESYGSLDVFRTVNRINVVSNSDPTNIENYFPDVYKTANNVYKIHVGTRKSQTYEFSLGEASQPSLVFVGGGYVTRDGSLIGKFRKYSVTNYFRFIYHTGTSGYLLLLPNQFKFAFQMHERPVIIIESTSTISVTEIHAEAAINQVAVGFWVPLASKYLAMIDSLNGGSGILQLRVTSTDDTFSVGIIKTQTRDVLYESHKFAKAYLTDGDGFWTNPHYVNEATDVFIQLQVTNGIMTIVAWKAGSQTAVRLTVPSGETQFAHEIWAMSNTYLSVSGTRSSELIPETIIDMCVQNSTCNENWVCFMTRVNIDKSSAGQCLQSDQVSDVSLDALDITGGARLYKKSHLVIWHDQSNLFGYDHTEHIRLKSNSRRLPDWFNDPNA